MINLKPFTSKSILPSAHKVFGKYEHDQYPGPDTSTTNKLRNMMENIGVCSSTKYMINNLAVQREPIFGGNPAIKLASEIAVVRKKAWWCGLSQTRVI